MKNMKQALLSLGVLSALVFGFQNCSEFGGGTNAEFSSEELSEIESLVPFCRNIDQGNFDMSLAYHWKESINYPEFNQIMSSPSVGDIDGDRIPEIAFVTFPDEFNEEKGTRTYTQKAVLRVINGRTKAELFSVGQDDLAPRVSTPLLVDIDRDGLAEIIYPHYKNTSIIALNHDGSLRWKAEGTQTFNYGGPAAFDFDYDGKAEIIVRGEILKEVIDENGQISVIRMPYKEGAGGTTSVGHVLNSRPAVVDGSGAYIYNGRSFEKLFTVEGAACGLNCFPSIADVDKSVPGKEIVYTGSGTFRIYDNQGNLLLDRNLTEHFPEDVCTNRGTVGGGQATLGNFDDDESTTEIAIATGRSLIIYDANGDKIAGSQTRDCSSLSTGVTSFDFNGDGNPEILYGDERKFRVYTITDSNDLEIIWETTNTNGTLHEYPVVVDVTGDFRPEVLVVSNNYSGIKNVEGNTQGLRIYEAPSTDLTQSWIPTRKIWNQHSYYVYNVNEDLTAANAAKLVNPKLLSSFKRNLPNTELKCRSEDPSSILIQ